MFARTVDNPHRRRWAELMQRSQEGEREAFCELVNEIGPVIARFLRRRIADEHELDDVCQETLLAIYESRHTYEPSRPFEPWMFAIARHVGAAHFKRNASRTSWQKIVDELPEKAVRDLGNLRVSFQEAMVQLPEIQREALVMMKVNGFSLQEVSERTGSSVGALKVRVHRAYEALRKNLLG